MDLVTPHRKKTFIESKPFGHSKSRARRLREGFDSSVCEFRGSVKRHDDLGALAAATREEIWAENEKVDLVSATKSTHTRHQQKTNNRTPSLSFISASDTKKGAGRQTFESKHARFFRSQSSLADHLSSIFFSWRGTLVQLWLKGYDLFCDAKNSTRCDYSTRYDESASVAPPDVSTTRCICTPLIPLKFFRLLFRYTGLRISPSTTFSTL